MFKSFKIRLFPTEEQEQMFYKHIGCCRSVWNFMLRYQKINHYLGGEYMSGYDMINKLTLLKKKKKRNYLNEVSNRSLQIVCSDLDKAFKRFFENCKKKKKNPGFPKFKSKKKSKKSFPIRDDGFYLLDNVCNIEKIGKVKYKADYKIKLPIGMNIVKFINPRVSLVHGKWILSFTVECDNQAQEKLSGRMGIDLGIKRYASIAYDSGFNVNYKGIKNINKSREIRRLESKLKHLQRKLARKYRTNGNYKNTNNILKTKKQIQDVYYKIHCIRMNFIHHMTKIIIDIGPEVIILENLSISNMMKNRHLSKSIQDACWDTFRRILEYKCKNKGIVVQYADKWYPSSKMCSKCGKIKKKLSLGERVYKCNKCGSEIDRDFNAAINLKEYYHH